MLSFSLTFQNNLNYASLSNIREVTKLYNLCKKSFETEFSSLQVKNNSNLDYESQHMLSFSLTFQNNLNYASLSNIREVTKFYNLCKKSFETEFSSLQVKNNSNLDYESQHMDFI